MITSLTAVRRRVFSTPRIARPSAFIATSNVATLRAGWLRRQATNQRVLP